MIPYGRHSVNWKDALLVAWQVRYRSLTQGQQIIEFEKQFAKYVAAKFAIAVSNATSGLHIALKAIDLPEDSAVITSPISFVASANAIVYNNLKPIFADIDSSTINMSALEVEKLLSKNNSISAIVPVHYGGLPCDMKELSRIAKENSLRIVEDAAHALGARYESGEMVGSCRFSDCTVFSFHPVKSITTGEGGMITTNSHEIYTRLLRLRSHGINKLDDHLENLELALTNNKMNPWYYEMKELGYNYRLTEIQATLGISQLKKLNRFITKRKGLVQRYNLSFQNHELVIPAQRTGFKISGHHLYVLRIRFDKLSIQRNEFMELLRINKIGSQVHYIPISLHPFYLKLGYQTQDYPNALEFYEQAISIPLFPKLSRRNQNKVIRVVLKTIDENRKILA